MLFVEGEERFDVYEVVGEGYRRIQSKKRLKTQDDKIIQIKMEDDLKKWLVSEGQLSTYSMEVVVEDQACLDEAYQVEGKHRLSVVVYDPDDKWGVYSLPMCSGEDVVSGRVNITEKNVSDATMKPVALDEYWGPMDELAFEERPVMYLYRIPRTDVFIIGEGGRFRTDVFIMGEGGRFKVGGAEIEAMEIRSSDFFMRYEEEGLIELEGAQKEEKLQEFLEQYKEDDAVAEEKDENEESNYNTGVEIGERKCLLLSKNPRYCLFRPGEAGFLRILAGEGANVEF